MDIVNGQGPQPSKLMFVGEAPGKEEFHRGYPFAGASGDEQRMYCRPYGINPNVHYRTNVSLEYMEGNPDPTPMQIEFWSPVLQADIDACQPELIVAVGRIAARWFLGERATMDEVHGMPHRCGHYDQSRKDRSRGAIILPVYHPAAGLHEAWYRPFIAWDYLQLSRLLNEDSGVRWAGIDTFKGNELYRNVTGRELENVLHPRDGRGRVLGLDTEGTKETPWSIQISIGAGTGLVLRVSQDSFAYGIDALRDYVESEDPLLVIQNAMWDIPVCRAMRIELSRCRIWDPMYAAYLLGYESQGLTPLARRFCNMEVGHFLDQVGDTYKARQLAYLLAADEYEWDRPDKREVRTPDGSYKSYHPFGLDHKLKGIFRDIRNRNDETWLDAKPGRHDKPAIDLKDRWHRSSGSEMYKKQIAKELVHEAESLLGAFPEPTPDDFPEDKKTYYPARDADACIRLLAPMQDELERMGLTDLMDEGMRHLRIPEQIQSTGMPAKVSYFVDLNRKMIDKAWSIQDELIERFNDGQPFNPNGDDVRDLMERRGLKSLKTTPTGRPSTAKPAIQHLIYSDPAIEKVFDFREHLKIATDFCQRVIDQGGGDDWVVIHPKVKITRTTSRRFAEENPNLMQVPGRTEIGRAVRKGYICPPGTRFGSIDYKQIEPRVVAHLSNDQELIKIFVERRDPYLEFASKLWDEEITDKEDTRRQVSKIIFLAGAMYGMAGESMKGRLWMEGLHGWEAEDCDRLLESLYLIYEGMSEYRDRSIREASELGYVRDDGGMYRYLPHLNSLNNKLQAEAERHCFSHKVQTYAQYITQKGSLALFEELKVLWNEGIDVRMCRQMHDEIMLWYEEREGLDERLERIATHSFIDGCGVKLKVPIEVEVNFGTNWGELK